MTAWTPVRLLGTMSFGDWTALAFIVGLIALCLGLQIMTWRRERRSWRAATRASCASYGVTRMHEEQAEAPPNQRAA